jgi:hypothetical protein
MKIQREQQVDKSDKFTVGGKGIDGFDALLLLVHVVDRPLKQALVVCVV